MIYLICLLEPKQAYGPSFAIDKHYWELCNIKKKTHSLIIYADNASILEIRKLRHGGLLKVIFQSQELSSVLCDDQDRWDSSGSEREAQEGRYV